MKFPDMTITTINLPTTLLGEIDRYATKRILNRSACVRELVTEALRSTEHNNSYRPLVKDMGKSEPSS
jgi:metal-responsive CopG/Arc/MetJ family transcriptional regulator